MALGENSLAEVRWAFSTPQLSWIQPWRQLHFDGFLRISLYRILWLSQRGGGWLHNLGERELTGMCVCEWGGGTLWEAKPVLKRAFWKKGKLNTHSPPREKKGFSINSRGGRPSGELLAIHRHHGSGSCEEVEYVRTVDGCRGGCACGAGRDTLYSTPSISLICWRGGCSKFLLLVYWGCLLFLTL